MALVLGDCKHTVRLEACCICRSESCDRCIIKNPSKYYIHGIPVCIPCIYNIIHNPVYRRTVGYHCMLCDSMFIPTNLKTNDESLCMNLKCGIRFVNFCDYCVSRGDLPIYHTFNHVAHNNDNKLTKENIEFIEQTKNNRYKYVQLELSRHMADSITSIVIEYYACIRKFVMPE